VKTTRAYDFTGTHLPIHIGGFPGDEVSDEPLIPRQRVVAFSPGLALAQPLVVERYDEHGEYILDIEIGIAEGRPQCIAIRGANGQPVTTTVLRFPLAEIVAEHAVAATFRVHRTLRGRYVGVHYPPGFKGMLGFGDELPKLEDEVRSGRRLDDAFFARVAALYREAVASGQSPGEVIRAELGPTTPENARRWVMQARQAGKLGPPVGKGRAGERSD
jgi:hypothetical protein